MPSESEEVWRYSGIDRFDLGSYSPPDPARVDGAKERDGSGLPLASSLAGSLGPRSALVVTRDGVTSALEVSGGVHDDVLRLTSARAGWTDPLPPPGLGELASARDVFGELHDAFLADAVLVEVAPKAVLADPVVVVHLVSAGDGTRGEGRGASCFPRTVVRVGPSAEAGVVELFVSLAGTDGAGGALASHDGVGGGRVLVVPVTELEVCQDARLRYASVQMLGGHCTQVALQASRVERDGQLRSFTAALGGGYARVRTDSDLAGQGAESSLLAAYLGTGDQVHDFRTLQDHHGKRTRSELLFKGAVADRAHSVYSGLIRIARGAHGSDAFQTNHNLVLSEGAHADSVPNLDIDENDVRCSHASTVGPIDEEQLYYLESRGVEPPIAERLVVLGFFADLAARAPFAQVGRLLERSVRERLSGAPAPVVGRDG